MSNPVNKPENKLDAGRATARSININLIIKYGKNLINFMFALLSPNLSYNYTMRFIGYDSIQSRWFISYRFQIRKIT